jgi:hypothetical protein
MVTPTDDMKFILKILGRNLDTPLASDIENPVHGQKARNSRGQDVIYDADRRNNKTGEMGVWVMPQSFSGREPVVIRGNGFVYTEFGIFLESDTDFSHPMDFADVQKIRTARKIAETESD